MPLLTLESLERNPCRQNLLLVDSRIGMKWVYENGEDIDWYVKNKTTWSIALEVAATFGFLEELKHASARVKTNANMAYIAAYENGHTECLDFILSKYKITCARPVYVYNENYEKMFRWIRDNGLTPPSKSDLLLHKDTSYYELFHGPVLEEDLALLINGKMDINEIMKYDLSKLKWAPPHTRPEIYKIHKFVDSNLMKLEIDSLEDFIYIFDMCEFPYFIAKRSDEQYDYIRNSDYEINDHDIKCIAFNGMSMHVLKDLMPQMRNYTIKYVLGHCCGRGLVEQVSYILSNNKNIDIKKEFVQSCKGGMLHMSKILYEYKQQDLNFVTKYHDVNVWLVSINPSLVERLPKNYIAPNLYRREDFYFANGEFHNPSNEKLNSYNKDMKKFTDCVKKSANY